MRNSPDDPRLEQPCFRLRKAPSHRSDFRSWTGDTKPGNIMISWLGDKIANAKIIDLGLAKGVLIEEDSPSAISIQGIFLGTPAYTSPEQFAGLGADIRSDLRGLCRNSRNNLILENDRGCGSWSA